MTDVAVTNGAPVTSAPGDRTLEGIIRYVQDESGYNFGDFPVTQAIFWMPPGHPNAPSPFRDAAGFPIALRIQSTWPGTPDTILFIFEDESEYRLYTLPFPAPDAAPDPVRPPLCRRFVLSKLSFSYSTQVMSFEAWRDLVVYDVRVAANDPTLNEDPDEDDEDNDDADTQPSAGPGTAPAAPRTA